MMKSLLIDKLPKNFWALNLVAISTFLFPKAGLNLQGIPFTVNLIVIGMLISNCFFRYFTEVELTKLILLSLMVPWLALCLSRSSALIENRTLRFGSIYWFLLVPFFWVSVECLRRRGRVVSPRLVVYCSLGATMFGIGQFLWGLNFLKIKGLTIAWGDSYDRKNLNIFSADTSIGTKIPSTFQGGNIWGQCSALILVWVVVFQAWRMFNSKLLQLASVASPFVAVFLSFSRTAVVAIVVTLTVYFLRDQKRFLGVGALVSFMALIVFFTSNLSLGRYSFESFTNSAGRSSQWSAGFTNYSLTDWLLGRTSIASGASFHMEGILGVFGQVGVVGFLLILFLWVNIFEQRFMWLGLTTLICLILDSTYLTPPLLLIPSLLTLANIEGAIEKSFLRQKQ